MSQSSAEPGLSHDPAPDPATVAAGIVAGASDAILAMDPSWAIVLWNGGCEALFGWTAEEVLGRSAELLLSPERRAEFQRVLGALAGASEAAALETEGLHRSGDVLPVSCRLSPIVSPAGDVVGVSAIVRDNSREMELRRQLEQARQLAEARFEQSLVAQVTLTSEGVLVQVNPAMCRLTGLDAKQLLGRTAVDVVADADKEATAARLRQLASGELAGSQHLRRLRHADGHVVETRVSVFPVRDESSGRVVRLEAILEDVSATAAAERELQLREARWQSLAVHASDVALFCDVDATLLYISSSVSSVFGYRQDQLLGADGWSFVHPDDVEAGKAVWQAVTTAPTGATATFETRVRHADGSWRWAEERVTNQLADPAVGALVVNLVDITERKAAEAVLDELAGTDSLTGLATRAPLLAALDAAFAAGLSGSTSVALVDLARMKLINDTYGHRVGDEVLCEVGARLQVAASGHGVVARVGGDRFAVLLHDRTDIAEVFEASAALLAAVEAPLRLNVHQLMLSAVVGAALGPAVESGALLAAAEAALATAKEGLTGPLHVVRAESSSAAVSRARLVEDLRRGLDQDELVVHFQPVMSLVDGSPVAAEALVRWAHPDKGLLTPGAFIDAAEGSGLIIEVGRKVLREACLAAARWADVCGDELPFHVAVNLSARQLTRGDVVEVVRGALADSGAAPVNLMLEVTESAVMADVDAAVSTLQELRDLGVAIAVDDFGTGYSSLTYLKRFPVTALKIDRSFVSGLGSNGDDAAIVTSVINLARAMQLECIAEGVETEQQRLVLQALGCAYGQGFLWSPALDVDTFETWLGTAARRSRGASGRGRPARRPPRPAAAPQSPQLAPRPSAPDPVVLARIQELSAKGASFATMAAALNADQQLTAEGRRWTSRSVAQLMAAGFRG